MKIYMIAGEASGDRLGAQAIRDLRAQYGSSLTINGVGGALMQAEGLRSLFPMEELSVMGVVEILPNLFSLLKRIDQVVQDIEKINPDLILSIDSPDFCFRVQKAVHKRRNCGAKQVHFVAPTVWAWRPGRAKKIAKFLDGILCLLPFEPPYFEAEGMKACFVGHPVMKSGILQADGAAFRARHGVQGRTLGIFPGSRRGELKNMGGILREAVARYADQNMTLPTLILPTLPHLQEQVRALFGDYQGQYIVTSNTAEKWEAFKACDAAVAVSGTVGLELAIADVPHAIAFRVNPLTAQIVKRMVRVRYAHLGNILLDAPIIPEFLQNECRAELIAEQIKILLQTDQEQQKNAFDQIRKLVKPPKETALQDFLAELI